MSGKIILPNSYLELAEEELKKGKSVRILADGASMYPFIKGGKDTVEIAPVLPNEKIKEGEVYFFKTSHRYVIHRLVKQKNDNLTMMGDGNRGIVEYVKRSDVSGKLIRIYCENGKTKDCSTWIWRYKGKVWHLLLPLRRYLLAAHRRLSNYGFIR